MDNIKTKILENDDIFQQQSKMLQDKLLELGRKLDSCANFGRNIRYFNNICLEFESNCQECDTEESLWENLKNDRKVLSDFYHSKSIIETLMVQKNPNIHLAKILILSKHFTATKDAAVKLVKKFGKRDLEEVLLEKSKEILKLSDHSEEKEIQKLSDYSEEELDFLEFLAEPEMSLPIQMLHLDMKNMKINQNLKYLPRLATQSLKIYKFENLASVLEDKDWKCKDFFISSTDQLELSMNREETKLLLEAIKERVEHVHVGQSGKVDLRLDIFHHYNGDGSCCQVTFYDLNDDDDLKTLEYWRERVNWKIEEVGNKRSYRKQDENVIMDRKSGSEDNNEEFEEDKQEKQNPVPKPRKKFSLNQESQDGTYKPMFDEMKEKGERRKVMVNMVNPPSGIERLHRDMVKQLESRLPQQMFFENSKEAPSIITFHHKTQRLDEKCQKTIEGNLVFLSRNIFKI